MLPDPIPSLKRQLAAEINRAIGHHHWSVAAHLLGIDHADARRIMRGRIGRFSLQRLVRLLARLEREVRISVVNYAPPRYTWVAPDRWRAPWAPPPYWDPSVLRTDVPEPP